MGFEAWPQEHYLSCGVTSAEILSKAAGFSDTCLSPSLSQFFHHSDWCFLYVWVTGVTKLVKHDSL